MSDGLRDALDGAPAGVIILDEEFRPLYHNDRLAEILGEEGEALARAVVRLLNGPILAQSMDIRDTTVDAVRPDGGTRTLRLTFGPVGYGFGEPVILWVYDVTDLRRAFEEADRAARHRSAFLATMSHEIRTPMNGVATLAELLADTPLDAGQAAMVGTIRASAAALLEILDGVLDFSKIEAGRLETEERPYAPAAVVGAVAAILRPQAEEKRLRLSATVAAEVPDWVIGDGGRVRQILVNLVGNAVKFTERGHVALRLTVPAPGRLRFAVEDSGIGMTGAEQARLFHPFVQADASVARRFGGSGLGLSICRGLAELMGGTIGVRSAPGEGSLFQVELPAPACAAPPSEPAAAPAAAGVWAAPERAAAVAARAVVLCAEDNATNRFVLHKVLGRLGIVHDMAADGEEALAMLDPAVHGLLLTDLHMPGVDGYELARRVRGRERSGSLPPLPILALSADAVQGTADACLEAGMAGHLTKPIRLDTLDAALAAHLPAAVRLRRPAGGGAGGAAGGAADGPAGPPAAAVEEGGPALDPAPLRALVGDDPAELRDALAGFAATAADLDAAIARAAGPEPGGRREALTAAHSLASASRYIGAAALAAAARALEEALAAGSPDAAALVPPVRAELGRVLRAVGELAGPPPLTPPG